MKRFVFLITSIMMVTFTVTLSSCGYDEEEELGKAITEELIESRWIGVRGVNGHDNLCRLSFSSDHTWHIDYETWDEICFNGDGILFNGDGTLVEDEGTFSVKGDKITITCKNGASNSQSTFKSEGTLYFWWPNDPNHFRFIMSDHGVTWKGGRIYW